MGKFSRLGNELYNGRRSIDFVHKRPLWYSISGGIVLAALLVVIFNGFNFGVEFTGGTEVRVSGLTSSQATQSTADDLRQAIVDAGIPGAEEPTVNTSGDSGMSIQTEDLTQANDQRLVDVITSVVDVADPAKQISPSDIGASWGRQVAQRAIVGVCVFLVLVMFFIGLYFREWKMSVAAFAALFHDIVITMGVYSLSGFSVTPSAVTGLLAILGFSLYDTVVVFDKVRENTHNLRESRTTYAAAANLAVNQTLARSINTGIVALIPIGAILYVSAVQLGASSLKDLALSQFVGMAAGVFSSVWVAPRILVHLKSNESDVKMAEKREKARARAEADRYASVPTFREDMPVVETPRELDLDDLDDDQVELEVEHAERRRASDTTATRLGQGRVAPPARGPVRESGASGRQQPTRQPRSQRGKKP
ncbi:preprotein translocase subunit SecF [Nocardioides terrae]|uniref:Protein-export membrane protein SecF n=1 Tax=Nocardioides terrae TaxID=574651 RepID=A0A1I1LWW8_9ACTN|nr:protein translocase subunit SecF [Nocardioides terrae]SFC77591.1 preprotein translocase subunit SecF [Nocardioides terrae]